METPWTPGPWKQVPEHVDTWQNKEVALHNEIGAPDGTHVICFGHDYDDAGRFDVPYEKYAPDTPSGEFDEDAWGEAVQESFANVRLIAAAPEMAELLEKWLLAASGTHIDNIAFDTTALIRRIRGEVEVRAGWGSPVVKNVPAPASPSLTDGERGSGPR